MKDLGKERGFKFSSIHILKNPGLDISSIENGFIYFSDRKSLRFEGYNLDKEDILKVFEKYKDLSVIAYSFKKSDDSNEYKSKYQESLILIDRGYINWGENTLFYEGTLNY